MAVDSSSSHPAGGSEVQAVQAEALQDLGIDWSGEPRGRGRRGWEGPLPSRGRSDGARFTPRKGSGAGGPPAEGGQGVPWRWQVNPQPSVEPLARACGWGSQWYGG